MYPSNKEIFQLKCKITKVQMPVIGVRDWFVNKEIPTEDLFLALY